MQRSNGRGGLQRSVRYRNSVMVTMLLLSYSPCLATRARADIHSDASLSLLRRRFQTGQQNNQDAPKLERGKPIERELAGDQAHSYRIALSTGQYLHVVVQQRGIDVVVALFGPDGKSLSEVDSPNGDNGPEPISFVTEVAGSYRLEVRSLEKTAKPGRYEVKVEELRSATAQDRGETLLMQAELLRGQGTDETLKQSIVKYKESLPHFRTSGDRDREALALNGIGLVSWSLRDNQTALEFYQQALQTRRAMGDRAGEALTLDGIGAVYSSLGENQKALDYHGQALPLRRAVGDKDGEGWTLNNMGTVYSDLGENQKALDHFAQALSLFRAVGDHEGEATALTNSAGTYQELGENKKALDSYAQALALFHAAGNRRSEAVTLSNIGIVYDALGENQKSLESYVQSLSLRRAVGDRYGEAATLHNMGSVFDGLGEKKKALAAYAQALTVFRAVGDRRAEAKTLNSIGAAYADIGETQTALDSYAQALPLSRAVGDRGGEAATLNNLGKIYKDIGENSKALDFYSQALALFRAVGKREGEATELNNIGGVFEDLGEKQKALDSYAQALPVWRAILDRKGEATTLRNMGGVYDDLGKKDEALEAYAKAVALSHAVANRTIEAATLNGMGIVYSSLGQYQKAFDSYAHALTLSRAIGDRAIEAKALFNMARAEHNRGNLKESLTDVETSLSIVESLRSRIGSQGFRASYFATVQPYHEFYIDLLMQLHKQMPSAGYDRRALQASERSRARSLIESLAEARADIRQGVDSTLLARERALQQQFDSRLRQEATLLRGTHTPEQASAIAHELEVLKTELEQTEAAIKAASPRYAALTQPSPLDLPALQNSLDSGTVLLEYSLGTDRSYVWAVTSNSVASYELPKRSVIEGAARQFYELLKGGSNIYVRGFGALQTSAVNAKARQQEMLTTGSRLSRMLLGPVAARIGNKRLVIVADGILSYLPFAALVDPATARGNASAVQPLIVRHEVVNLPSVSVLATLRRDVQARTPAPRTLAVFADPVFDPHDPRVRSSSAQPTTASNAASSAEVNGINAQVKQSAAETGARRDGDQLQRLEGTRQEADSILAMVPANQSKRAFDFDASRAAVTSGELSQYKYLHFATHGLLNSLHPELTAVVLSLVDENGNPQDGFLRASEIYNLKLPAELAVLSACETGLGSEVKGEGLIGLTRGFMYAGTPRVVVSLWKVDDNATAELMVSFYRGMLREGKRPAEALRAAQIAMWKQDRLRAPYYWAAFALQGEWK